LQGELSENELVLNRFGEDNVIKEVFKVNTKSLNNNLEGTWKLKKNEPVDFQLNYKSSYGDFSSSFLSDVKYLLSDYGAVTYANIDDVQKIKDGDGQFYLESNDILYCHFSGNRIYTSGTYNNSSSSRDEEMTFVFLPRANAMPGAGEVSSFARLSVFNIYDYSNVTEFSEGDEGIELTNFWELTIHNSSAGELWDSQTLNGEGTGVMNFIFDKNQLTLIDGNGKQNYYYDNDEHKYIK
jgi:hypothetical protein